MTEINIIPITLIDKDEIFFFLYSIQSENIIIKNFLFFFKKIFYKEVDATAVPTEPT